MIIWLKEITGVGTTYLFYYAQILIAVSILTAVLFALRRRISPRLRGFVIAVILILLVRLLILDNPLAWNYYKDELGRDKHNIGSRQRDIIKHRAKLFERDIASKKLPYLVVGSSQTDFLFSDYADKNDDFGLIHIAALGPIDYVLYRREIESMNPETIILFISEFDLGRLWWTRYYLAPDQGLSIISFYNLFRDSPYKKYSTRVIKDLVVGELFPEVKFSYIFKGLLKKKTGRDEAYKAKRANRKRGKQVVLFGEPIEETRFSFTFLEDFIRFCENKDIKVIILQGDYNPKFFHEGAKTVRQLTVELIDGLDERYDHVTYIKKDRLYNLVEEDFYDFLHVKKESARKYRARLFKEHLNIALPEDSK